MRPPKCMDHIHHSLLLLDTRFPKLLGICPQKFSDKFPPKSVVYNYFSKFNQIGTFLWFGVHVLMLSTHAGVLSEVTDFLMDNWKII